MALYMIGLGLRSERDISFEGLETVRRCNKAYLEDYTSVLSCNLKDLERFYGKKVIPANRELVESGKEILAESRSLDIALLIVGDVFSATTHISLYLDAKRAGVPIRVIPNASVLTAVGITGLELYRFGQTTSIPFDNKNILGPIEALKRNQSAGLHTLFLLDLSPRLMQIPDAVSYLVGKGVKKDTLSVACGGLGDAAPEIIYARLDSLGSISMVPQCLIIPGRLHFVEQESLELYRRPVKGR